MNNTSTPSVIVNMPVVEAVRMGMLKKNRLAMICGAVMGGFVPAVSFAVAHYEFIPAFQKQDVLEAVISGIMVLGGLIYSANSVFEFAKQAFKKPAKALGFVIISEGAMTFSHNPWVFFSALGLLVVVNGIAAGVNLALDVKKPSKKK